MQLWKRILFSVVSLIWGYISLDYLYYAFSALTNVKGNAENYSAGKDGLYQLLGAGMILLWFLLLAVYFWYIRKCSPKIDFIETDEKSGEEKIKRKWTDVVLQVAFIITGMVIRWGYVVYIYLPQAK